MMGKIKRILPAAFAVVFCVLWVCLLLIPTGVRTGAAAEESLCVWSDGSTSHEEYLQAYSAYAGLSADGDILLERNGVQGKIETSEAFRACNGTLSTGGLSHLLSMRVTGLSRLERAALWREHRNRLWYSDGLFRFTGDRVERVDEAHGESLILLSGGITASVLKTVGVRRLELRAEAEITVRYLLDTGIEEVFAHAPYSVSDGAIYLDTVVGKRLIAGIPKAKTVRVQGNAFADRGALSPCAEIEELTLPFLGNAEAAESDGSEMLAWLFGSGSEYQIPAKLKRLTVTGGEISDRAFYRCDTLEEINLCGMDGGRISPKAFAGCTGLNRLHTPCAVDLGSDYTVRPLGCGCLLYEKV